MQTMNITNNYVAFDIETTGLNPKYEKIIEIGAIKVRNGEIVETFSTFINPAKSLPANIVELTGIHDEDVKNAPYIDEVLDKFIEFTKDDILLGHNLIFDYSFIKKAAVNQKKEYDKDGIDTLRIARHFLSNLESRKLTFLCEYYKIHLDAHRALNDAVAAHEVYKKLVEDYASTEVEIFTPKPLVYNVKKESPITPRQLALLKQLADRYKLTCDGDTLYPVPEVTGEYIDLSKISKNEASRLIDKLLASFGR
jgi:DNA polymerase-3 subunit alpha (Gram-positive type)